MEKPQKKKKKIHRDGTVGGMSGWSQNVFLEIETVARDKRKSRHRDTDHNFSFR